MISYILFVLYGIFSASADVVQFKFYSSKFRKWFPKKFMFFNPEISWKNKYKDNDVMKGPKYFGSTTIFVIFTDAWHLFKALSVVTIFCAAIFAPSIISGLIGLLVGKIVFEFMFRYLGKK